MGQLPPPVDALDFRADDAIYWRWTGRIENWDQELEWLVRYNDLPYYVRANIGALGSPATLVTPENVCKIPVSLVLCTDLRDDTNANIPAPFTILVNGSPLAVKHDGNGGGTHCQPVFLELNSIQQTVDVQFLTPATWQHAPGYPQRRVIFNVDNTQLSRPGDSVEVRFYEAGGYRACYEGGIETLNPLTEVEIPPIGPNGGLNCHVVFNSVRVESTETPTPTPTMPTPTPEDPAETPEPPTTNDDPTATPTPPASEESPTPGTTQTPEAETTASPTPQPSSGGGTTGNPPSSGGSSGEQGGTDGAPAAEETVAGERTPASGSTPIAPSTGETPELAGTHASVWAVIACLLLAASIGFTTLALWQRDRQR
jgi:hypothetical protein